MELVKYEKKFEIQMSKGESFNLSEEQMNFFDKCFEERVMFKLKDGTRINPSFFISAKSFEDIQGLSEYQLKKISEKNQSIGGKAALKMKMEWAKILKNGGTLFN